MFYSTCYADLKAQYAKIWLAAHCSNHRKLRKTDVEKTNVVETVDSIIKSTEKISLRIASQLLMGVTRIHIRKGELLYFDSFNILNLLKRKALEANIPKPFKERAKRTKIVPNVLPKNTKIFTNFTEKEISAAFEDNSEQDMELLSRGSQQKMAREEDISLPKESEFAAPNGLENFQSIENSHRMSHSQDRDSVEVPRIRAETNSPVDNFEDVDFGADFEDSFEVNTKKIAERMMKDFVFVDEETQLKDKSAYEEKRSYPSSKEALKQLEFDDGRLDFVKQFCNLTDFGKTGKNAKSEIGSKRKRGLEEKAVKLLAENALKREKFGQMASESEMFEMDNFEMDENLISDGDNNGFAFPSEASNDSSMVSGTEKKSKRVRFNKLVLSEIEKRCEEKESVTFDELTKGSRRRTMTKAFYEVLCLKSGSFINVNQEEAFGDINIQMIR